MFFKIDVFTNLAIFTGKNMQACQPSNLLKTSSNTSAFYEYCKIFKNDFFLHLQSLSFKLMFETCQNFTVKNKKGFY